ncbi:MAG: phage tail terminator-like protein [Asticcacaulis sp.]|uniref:phage tail terminator-like protein n=1 Tax=Asticcacaulis sp. TaxID=1872648 RepID=UPI0039E6AA97
MTEPTVEQKIWQALKARVLTLPVFYPQEMPLDDDFTKPVDGNGPTPYIEVRHLPNNSTRILITSPGPHDRRGLIQLTLCIPVSMKRSYEQVKQQAGDIAAWFPCDFKMSFQGVTVRVEKAPDEAQPYREDGYIRVPVTVNYQAYA